MPRSEKAREAQRIYIREWRKRNPEKVRVIQERYWENRLAKMKVEEKVTGAETEEKEAM